MEDLFNTLIACRWIPGTTTRPVNNPTNNQFEVVTVDPGEVFAFVRNLPVKVINYYPDPTSGPPAMNTLAVDAPRPADPEEMELGSTLVSQPYQISLVFYANNDATAQALFSDLGDRYAGRLVNGQAIALYDYMGESDDVVGHMEVEAFRFARDLDTANQAERTTYFAELELVDTLV
jgi:hypothetical protein